MFKISEVDALQLFLPQKRQAVYIVVPIYFVLNLIYTRTKQIIEVKWSKSKTTKTILSISNAVILRIK